MSARDPWFIAMETLLRASTSARDVPGHDAPPKQRPRQRMGHGPRARIYSGVQWVPSTLRETLDASAGRVVVTVRDAKYGTEVVEVVQWGPRRRGLAMARLDAVLGSEQLRAVRCERAALR